ncbi:MAG: hypothetical protein RR458_03145 [Clostridia bacterium]
MNNKKINWSKMHDHGYNECVYCGGKCTNDESIANWKLATDELEIARQNNDQKRIKYLQKKIDDKLNYRMN